MMRSWYERPLSTLVLVVGSVFLFSHCDLPTQAPDFSFTTGVRTPVLFDQTFVFLGPSADGADALIDTTSTTFDSLFTVNPLDQSVFIVEELDDFDLGSLDGVLPEVDLAPVTVEVDLGNLTEQRFETSFTTELGIFENPSQSFPTASPMIENGAAVISLSADQVFPAPEFELLETDRSTPQEIVLTADSDGVNAFVFVLTNGLDVPLTDGTEDPSAAPQIILERGDGSEIARGRFDRVPGPGGTASARVSVAGQTLRGNLSYRFDLSTPDGFAPVESNPEQITVASEIEPLRYSETLLSSIPAQADIDASQPEITLAGEVDFSGIVTASGQLQFSITNHLPIPVRIDDLTLRNLEAVDGYPANHVLLRTQVSSEIAPGAAATLPVDLGQTGIAPRVAVEARASSDGLAGQARLRASDGLAITVDGDVQVERLYFTPGVEHFVKSGTIDLDIDDVTFDPGTDFIELKQGTLEIAELVNELDLSLSTLQLSLPAFRLPPYGPADSLVIRFEGSTDDPGANKFRGIAAKSSLQNLAVDLADVRIYPDGSQLTYNVAATSEAASKTSVLDVADRIRASIGATDLTLRHVAATLDPFSVAMTEDVDGDDRLDLLSDEEAVVSEFGDFSALSDRLAGGLQIEGSALTFSLTTNLTTDIDFYAAIVGTTAGGERVFLGGRGDYAVAPSDSLVGSFTMGGVPLQADQLIRFRITGADSPDQPHTNTIVLSADNSAVDAFVSKLPESLRFVGKAVVGGNGRVELREPFELGAAVQANIPLNIGGVFTMQDTLSTDMEGFADLTNPDETVTVEEAALMLSYDNGIPLGIDTRLDVVDAQGEVLLTLPNTEAGTLRLDAAPVDDAGVATGQTAGEMEFPISQDDLRTLSSGEQILLRMTVAPPAEQVARLRATDRIRLSLKGNIRLNVQAGH